MLVVDRLNIAYGDAKVLTDITISVNSGEIVAIVGSNGAGKSTLLKGISRIVNISSGTITFLSEEISQLLPHQVVERGIVQIPEGRKIFPNMKVIENLEVCSVFKNAKRMRKENLKFVFELFPRLKERSSQVAGSLSGGEQQMLAIAQGLMSCPKLLMVDEPSLGLAPVVVDQIFETIQNINGQGVTVLLVEQNIELSLEISSRAYVLETGRITLEGKDLISHPHVREAYLGL